MSIEDLKLQLVNGKFDIDFDTDGDLIEDLGMDTSILISLFLNKRADESEVPQPILRGGYWGVDITGMEFSKLWLVNGRKTTDKLNQSIKFCNEALQWLIDEGYAVDVNTIASFTDNGIELNISITKINGIIESKVYQLWLNTTY
jgi:phage gp46-like protein